MVKESRGTRDNLSRRRAAIRVSGRHSASSRRWLTRQLNDPYVEDARKAGYRSRAAFKLIELDDRFGLLKAGGRVLDLGAAPGGWSQVAVERVAAGKQKGGRVLALDCVAMEPIPGVEIVLRDAREALDVAAIVAALGGPADLVLSDMAAPSTGHARTDHLRVIALCEAALDLAELVLAPGGAFVAKVLKGGTEKLLLERLKRGFQTVKHVKPPASRADSAEIYVVALGFRGGSA
jgi:23S rRNA (uridine2552-2'-O)-methyltransferase